MKHRITIREERHLQRVLDIVRDLPLEPPHVVSIEPYKDSKTLAQVRTVHGLIRQIQVFFAESQGKAYTMDALKDYFKGLFGEVEVLETPAGVKERYMSFADYKIDQMAKFIDNLDRHCVSEFGLYLVMPGMEDM